MQPTGSVRTSMPAMKPCTSWSTLGPLRWRSCSSTTSHTARHAVAPQATQKPNAPGAAKARSQAKQRQQQQAVRKATPPAAEPPRINLFDVSASTSIAMPDISLDDILNGMSPSSTSHQSTEDESRPRDGSSQQHVAGSDSTKGIKGSSQRRGSQQTSLKSPSSKSSLSASSTASSKSSSSQATAGRLKDKSPPLSKELEFEEEEATVRSSSSSDTTLKRPQRPPQRPATSTSATSSSGTTADLVRRALERVGRERESTLQASRADSQALRAARTLPPQPAKQPPVGQDGMRKGLASPLGHDLAPPARPLARPQPPHDHAGTPTTAPPGTTLPTSTSLPDSSQAPAGSSLRQRSKLFDMLGPGPLQASQPQAGSWVAAGNHQPGGAPVVQSTRTTRRPTSSRARSTAPTAAPTTSPASAMVASTSLPEASVVDASPAPPPLYLSNPQAASAKPSAKRSASLRAHPNVSVANGDILAMLLASNKPPEQQRTPPVIMPNVRVSKPAPALQLLDSISQLDSSNWEETVMQVFPEVYNRDYHEAFYEFVFDLWPAVGKGHDKNDKTLLPRAYQLLQRAWDSPDRAICHAAVVGLVENICHYDGLFAECCEMMSKEVLHGAVVPLMAHYHPKEFPEFMLFVKDVLGKVYQPQSMPAEWQQLVKKLERLQAVYPPVSLTVLTYIQDQHYN